jgi:Zn-finger nucleic acid-binding protein
MPLLVSPIDGSPMKQIVRNGIEIDMCPTTGGVWLDKGELEKLLAAVQEAIDESDDDFQSFKKAKHEKRLPPEYYQQPSQPPHGHAYPHKRYSDDDYDDYHKYKYGKKSKLKTFLDIFD